MIQRNIEEPLIEVRKWKKETAVFTKGMTPEKVVEYFRREAEDMWMEYGYNCTEADKKSCRHTK